MMSKDLSWLKSYRIEDGLPLFLIGSFDKNVTVLTQQIRALNLAYGLFESSALPVRGEKRKSVAIVGAGFAGLTFGAALLKKQAAVDITIFEECDTLLPLQQGSDSRWLHPQIYDWPADLSEAPAAMLPVLNWTAARASDVVVQVLTEWRSVVDDAKPASGELQLYCNTRHLQIDRSEVGTVEVEWIGEPRTPIDGHPKSEAAAIGKSELFDVVVLAVGFGLEKDDAPSYWRNETLGQPSLTRSRATYLVAGQGDGAMIDLLRLRISQYRQDRILDELFAGKTNLLGELRRLKSDRTTTANLFARFKALRTTNEQTAVEWDELLKELRRRLRRDTDVVLHLRAKVRNLAALFRPDERRMSFQNALLVFLLYECGGFVPSTEDEQRLAERFSIRKEHLVKRPGPNPPGQFTRLLSEGLNGQVDKTKLQQEAPIRWKGGYFGMPVREERLGEVDNAARKTWRKEYLPGPTALLGTTICGAVAGVLARLRPTVEHDRVTLHRVLELHGETLLQQLCDYAGRTAPVPPKQSTSGRIFPIDMATIGQAYGCRRAVRSLEKASPGELRQAMDLLGIKGGASDMEKQVTFLLAIPILQPSTRYYGPSRVAGVLYVDSRSPGYWLEDDEVDKVCGVLRDSLKGLVLEFGRLRNFLPSAARENDTSSMPLRKEVEFALEALSAIDPPITPRAFQFNFDVSDLIPLEQPISAP